MSGKSRLFYTYTIYFIVTTLIILLTGILLTDIIWGIGIFIFKSKMIGMPPVSLLIGISLLCAVWALYEGIKIPDIKITTIQSAKIKQSKILVFLSDLHIHRTTNPHKIDGIIQRVNALKPDIIILGGDTIDDSLVRTQHIISKLKNIQTRQSNTRFFVAGNHEFYHGFQENISFLKSLNYIFLENSGSSLGDLYIAGIPDLTHSSTPVQLIQAFQESTPNQFRILISHTPTDFQSDNNFDLELSGHTHGGQIFPFHILTKLYNKSFLSGLYNLPNKARLYVSHGAGQWGPQMRFLAPSEITVIHLQPQQKKQGEKYDTHKNRKSI